MSVVVAVKEKGKIIIGTDSQTSKGRTKITSSNINNLKVWKVKGVDNCLMALVGNKRNANVLRIMDDLISDYDVYKERIDFDFVVSSIVPDIINQLKEYNFIAVEKNYISAIDSSILFAYKDKLYYINEDCCVIEIDDYIAIGSGCSEALGSLSTTEGINGKERVLKAVKASLSNDIYVDYPIAIADTEEMEIAIVTEENEKEYLSKLK